MQDFKMIVQQRAPRADADQKDGARAIERALQYPLGSVLLRDAPLRSGDGFPRSRRGGREYELQQMTPALRLMLRDSDHDVWHVIARRLRTATRLIVPIPSRRSSRRMADLVLLLDRGVPPYRVDEELGELFQTLLPHRTSNSKFYRAVDGPLRTWRARSADESLTA
jgi:hypothetical protein